VVDSPRHQARAHQNEEFFQGFDLAGTPYLDWAVTALLYGALHYIEAYLGRYAGLIGGQTPSSAGGHHSDSHRERFLKLSGNSFLSAIQAEYHELYDRSIDARYNLAPITATDVQGLYDRQFRIIRDHLLPLL